MNVVPLDTDEHHAVQALLPWYATHRLDSEDVALVEAHLATCPRCRAELDLERTLQTVQPLSNQRGDVERGLAKMRELIQPGPQHARPAPWLRWVLGGQFAVIALLSAMLVLPRAGVDVYRALGTPSAAPAANAVVMFKPGATEQEIRAALRSSGARLVDGPTASNAYLLSLPSQGHAAAITLLRAQPAVSLAESLDARPAP
jgi:anti-sigma factor RsiW